MNESYTADRITLLLFDEVFSYLVVSLVSRLIQLIVLATSISQVSNEQMNFSWFSLRPLLQLFE